MPNAKGHLLGGLAFFILSGSIPLTRKYLPFATPTQTLVGLPICLLGALFPDIDTHSIGRKILNLFILMSAITALHFKKYAVVLQLLSLASITFLASHRGITHNPLFVTTAPAMIFYSFKSHLKWLPEINTKYYLAFILGGLSHIILDLTQTTLKRNNPFRSKKTTRKGSLRFWW